jgi:hypothetical protein
MTTKNCFNPMVYDQIHAKPVSFEGVQYRSKLEAKWAMMFKHLEWNCSYEPIKIGSWIPDFVIFGSRRPTHPVFVEVKPLDAYESVNKLDLIPNYFDILLVGNGPQESTHIGHPRIGWIRNCGEWGNAMMQKYHGARNRFDFTPDNGFDGTGRMHGNLCDGDNSSLFLRELKKAWDECCDTVSQKAIETYPQRNTP